MHRHITTLITAFLVPPQIWPLTPTQMDGNVKEKKMMENVEILSPIHLYAKYISC